MTRCFCCCLVVWVWAAVGAGSIAGDDLPNIVVIITDDQGYPPLAAHGHPWIRTPNLDELYRQSTRISHFLVSPTCSPTRAALMTGRHPMRVGVTHTILERERLALDAVTLPEVLRRRGYVTGIFGKWHLGDEDAYQPNRRGFDHALIHGAGGIGQAYDCSCADVPGNGYFDPVLRENGTFVQTSGFCTDVFFDGAMQWIETESKQSAAKPFFVWLATNAPHAPFHAPPEFRRRFLEAGFADGPAGFFGMIENIDYNVGRLLAKLDQLQLSGNTLVIFLSDNGMSGTGVDAGAEFAPGFVNDNRGMKGLKGSTDEGGVRVPFLMRWPGRISADHECQIVAAHIDLLPTLAEVAGAELPAKVDGRSFWQRVHSDQSPWFDRLLVTHTGRWPTGANPDDWQWVNYSIRNHQFRYVGPTGKDAPGNRQRGKLFDMIADPAQTTDVAAQHESLIEEMESFYDDWWQQTRPGLINETAPMSPTRPWWIAFENQQSTTGIPRWQPDDQ